MRENKITMAEKYVLSRVVCNGCGKEISMDAADHFHGEKTWGYFSDMDGRQDCFDLGEECDDKITENFAVKLK